MRIADLPSQPVTGAATPGETAVRELDRALYAQIAWWTQGLSPASLAAAATDWLVHLAGSPDKQR